MINLKSQDIPDDKLNLTRAARLFVIRKKICQIYHNPKISIIPFYSLFNPKY